MFKWKLLHPGTCKVRTLTRYVTVGDKNSGKTKPVSVTFKVSITPNRDDREWRKIEHSSCRYCNKLWVLLNTILVPSITQYCHIILLYPLETEFVSKLELWTGTVLKERDLSLHNQTRYEKLLDMNTKTRDNHCHHPSIITSQKVFLGKKNIPLTVACYEAPQLYAVA